MVDLPPGPGDLLFVGFFQRIQIPDLVLQPKFLPYLGISEGGHHVLEGRLRGVEGIVEGPVADIPPHDLIDELDLSPGPIIGRILEEIREAQATGLINDKEAALELARKIKSDG